MGNEKSNLGTIEIKPDVIEVTNSWTLKHAVCTSSSSQCSVFSSPADSSSSLDLASKNLKIYRHPGIVKFIQTWTQSGSLNLATEHVFPLSEVLGAQTNLQVCLGLRSILRALVFLHNTATVAHTNVCCASIYVSTDNTWKLGNFEFLSKYIDLTSEKLRITRSRRYEFAIPPEESAGSHVDPVALDTYAFGVLVQEVLKKRDLTNDPSGQEFFDLACKTLQGKQYKSRGNLADLIEHPYFSHPVVGIMEFLSAITLKTTSEKEQFFKGLWAQLATLPETMVATQLADLLLSRLVLLEPSAQTQLVPWLLAIKDDQSSNSTFQSGNCLPLFSRTVFERFLSPKLVNIFRVHDSQVRSVLLKHFSSYCHGFTNDQLQHHILPELLVGIKDNDDILVSTTLRALAELVPILGAATVIGGKRGKLFTDGRPKIRPARKSMPLPMAVPAPTRSIPELVTVPRAAVIESNNDDINGETETLVPASLPERLSPDGGEAWSDWDDQQDEDEEEVEPTEEDDAPAKYQTSPAPKKTETASSIPPNVVIRKVVDDIDAMDIKAAKINVTSTEKEVDFFQDMEPVIQSSAKPNLLEVKEEPSISKTNDKFSVAVTDDPSDGTGWGEVEDFDDWGEQEVDLTSKEGEESLLDL